MRECFRRQILMTMLVVEAFFSSAPVHGAEASCLITDFGLIGANTEALRVPNVTTATGRYSVIQRGEMLERTAVIPARLGTYFGVARTLSNFPEGENAELVIVHPQIVTPAGLALTRAVVPASPSSVANGYRLDESYEVVLGTWTFEFFYRGKSLCRQTFQLVTPPVSR
jgi:Domain of unknown function (DUF3859)